jgi:transketolase
MLDRTLLAVENMDVTVLYATTAVPFDGERVRNAAGTASGNVILVEPYYEGGLVHEIARALQAVPIRIEAIGVPRRILDKYGPPDLLDREVGLTVDGIRDRISRFLNSRI